MGWRLLCQRLPQKTQGEKPKADSGNIAGLAHRAVLVLAMRIIRKGTMMDIQVWLAFVAATCVGLSFLKAIADALLADQLQGMIRKAA